VDETREGRDWVGTGSGGRADAGREELAVRREEEGCTRDWGEAEK
jgi:hypothetical protein